MGAILESDVFWLARRRISKDTKEGRSTLIDLTWDVQRTGEVIPVLHVEEVMVGSHTVTHVLFAQPNDLHVYDLKPGDEVVFRRNPKGYAYVIGKGTVGMDGKRYGTPHKCPSCNGRLYVENGRRFCLKGQACADQLKLALRHYASKQAMDIPMLTGPLANTLVDVGMIKHIADIYTLSADVVFFLECMTYERADQLIEQINDSRRRSLDRFIWGLGIPGVKVTSAWELAHHYETMGAFFRAKTDDLQHINLIGPKLSVTVAQWLQAPQNKMVCNAFTRVFTENGNTGPKKSRAVIKQLPKYPLRNKRFLLSGNFTYQSKNEIRAFLKALGGREVGRVTLVTNVVILGKDYDTEVFQQARKCKVDIQDEDYLRILRRDYAYMLDR